MLGDESEYVEEECQCCCVVMHLQEYLHHVGWEVNVQEFDYVEGIERIDGHESVGTDARCQGVYCSG